MRGMFLRVLICLIMVGLLFSGLQLAEYIDRKEEDQKVKEEEVGSSFYGVTVVGMKEGLKEWEIQAEKIEEVKGEAHIEQIILGTLFKDGDKYLTFTAKRGFWDKDSMLLKLNGQVEIFKDDEKILTTEEFIWFGEEEVFHSPVKVELYHKGDTVYANSMVGYPKEEEVVLQGNVHLISGNMHLLMEDMVVYDLAKEAFSGTGKGQVIISGKKAIKI